MQPFILQDCIYGWTNLDFVGAELKLSLLQPGGSPKDNPAGAIHAAARTRIASAFAEFRNAFVRDNASYACYLGLRQRHAAEVSSLAGLRQQVAHLETEIVHVLSQDGDPVALECRLDKLRGEIVRIEGRIGALAALEAEARARAKSAWHAAVSEFSAGLRRDCAAEAEARRATLLALLNDLAEPTLVALQAEAMAQGQLPLSTSFPSAV